jgi:hypothetical protein
MAGSLNTPMKDHAPYFRGYCGYLELARHVNVFFPDDRRMSDPLRSMSLYRSTLRRKPLSRCRIAVAFFGA